MAKSDAVEAPTGPDPKTPVEESLRPEHVRWFYKKTSRQKTWEPLNGRDSLAIENGYRRHQALRNVDSDAGHREPASDQTSVEGHVPEWAKTAVAFDGLYGLFYDQVALASTNSGTQSKSEDSHPARFPYRLKPLYWLGPKINLARGTWFLEMNGGVWQPLDVTSPDLVQRIEEQHLKILPRLREQPRGKASSSAPVICELADAEEQAKAGSGVKVCWYNTNDIRLHNYSHSSRLWRWLRLSTAGTKLIQGYTSEARQDDGPPLVTDLVFVVHGIGEKWKKSRIASKTAGMRDSADRMLKKYYPDQPHHHPILLPVDWRSDLKLDEHTIISLTPTFLADMRAFFNDNLMDLMYYASPVYGQKITRSLSNVLNRMFNTFVAHDPAFFSRNGRISLLAHSLGSVIAYDLLSMEGCAIGAKGTDRINIQAQAGLSTPRLIFRVDNLFCVGSPLGVFLAGRQVRGRCILHPPGGTMSFRVYNIYHPADLVAYRIEPLISETYADISPVRIHKADARERRPYQDMPSESLERPGTTKTSIAKKDTVDVSAFEALPYRVDFELQPGRVNKYWAAFTSHYQYWQNRDVVMFLLTALYGAPPQSTTAPSPTPSTKPKAE